MKTLFEKMEACQLAVSGDKATALAGLKLALADTDWRVRYAAVVAAGDLHAAELAPALLDVLRDEDASPLYTQVGEVGGGPAGANTTMKARIGETDEATLDAWRRRGRIKQAVLWALSDIGETSGRVREFLHRYATDKKEDYAVRAAACHALRVLGDAGSVAALEQAAKDDEWCTNCEAKKSLRVLRKNR